MIDFKNINENKTIELFVKALNKLDFTIIKVSVHGQQEHGADIIAIAKDTLGLDQIYYFQVKVENITAKKWRNEIKGQIDAMLDFNPIDPGIPQHAAIRRILVYTKKISDDALSEIVKHYNDKHPRIEFIDDKKLLKIIEKSEEIQDEDYKLIKFFSNIKLNEEDLIKIRDGEIEDPFQKLVDKIIKSYNNDELSLFRKLVGILDRYWNAIINNFNESTNTRPISSYFVEHYTRIIFKIMDKNIDDEYYEPILTYYEPVLTSFQNNVKNFISIKEKLNENTYLADCLYFSNIFISIIEKCIEKSNYWIFISSFDYLIDQIELAVKYRFGDFNIFIYYIHNLESIVESACEKRFHIDLLSVRLSKVGIDLASSELVQSLENLLNIFDSLINIEINWKDKDNLIITLRSLMYICIHCKTERIKNCYEKIISILMKFDSQPNLLVILSIAYDKTQELLGDDVEGKKDLIKITDYLDNLKRLYI